MKILQIHKYYTKNRGAGSVTAFFETIKLLKRKGHKVIIFSMNDPDNYPTKYQKYFTEHFDLNVISFWKKVWLIPKTIFNREAQRNLEQLIKDEKPDVAHIHNIYHYLTPSIFHTLKKMKVPMVFKLSDYKAICPNKFLFNQGKICEKCKGGKYYWCFLNRCIKNSWAFSFVGMIEAYVHRWLKSYEKIDLFLAPSEFMKRKCIEFGIPENKIKILRNVMNPDSFKKPANFREENHFLYVGRISQEKGIDQAIKAVKVLSKRGILGQSKFYIMGKGDDEGRLQNLVNRLGLKKQVDFLGFMTGAKRDEIITNSKFMIVPSIWYDNSPTVISEAGMLGKPVIVSDLGGSPEMVIDEETGFVCDAMNVGELATVIHRMLNLGKEKRERMGQQGREFIGKINNEGEYYEKLMRYYKGLL